MQSFSATQFPLKIPAALLALCFSLLSQTAAAEETNLRCYGIYDSEKKFLMRSDLFVKRWGKNDRGQQITLQGKWHKSAFTETKENFFVATSLSGQTITADKLHKKLRAMCQETLVKEVGTKFEMIRYYASDSAAGYEYPILSDDENKKGLPTAFQFNNWNFVRYALASGLACGVKNSEKNQKYHANEHFKRLMIYEGEEKVRTIGTHNSPLLKAIALQVPTVSLKTGELHEEVILAFKGTDPKSSSDLLTDVAIATENLDILRTYGAALPIYKEAYDFTQKIIEDFTPHNVLRGYKEYPGERKYRVVITGHSLGGYIGSDVAFRTGLAARTFAAPAWFSVHPFTPLDNTMLVGNVLNIYLPGDPIANFSGRHAENLLEYAPESTNTSGLGLDRHKLPVIISAIEQAKPKSSRITPDAMSGFGLIDPNSK